MVTAEGLADGAGSDGRRERAVCPNADRRRLRRALPLDTLFGKMPAGEESGKIERESLFESPFEKGQVLAGKFRVLDLLGKGGMGYVLDAEHMHLGRRVAIKLLRPEHAKRKEWGTRFMREARMAATLPTDHVVQTLDVAMLEDATPYMVMEYLEGVDLGALIDREQMVEPAEAVGVVLQACEAFSSSPPPIVPVPAGSASAGHGAQMVTLLLQLKPEDAVVAIDGQVVTKRKLRFAKSNEPLTLVVSAPGYVTSENEFTPSVGGTLVVELKPRRKR